MSAITNLKPVEERPRGNLEMSGAFNDPGSVPDGIGSLIVNADDWGVNSWITGATLDCIQRQTVSSVSAMVFMEDSDRAAELARRQQIDAGLHLNLTMAFTGKGCPFKLVEEQGKIARYLRSSRVAQAVFHPGLYRAFDYVVKAQLEEFERLYGCAVRRVDGHHHMHLCENVLSPHLLPSGIIVRRNFSFRRGEKSALNRLYRRWQDRRLAKRHRIADFFFALLPLEPERLADLVALALRHNVEVETHPNREEEYRFLISGGLCQFAGARGVTSGYCLRSKD